jgi:hypothetical protein
MQQSPRAPLRATSSKSQPPHLVLDSHNCHYNQNLSFDHLLSGVIADYYEIRALVNRHESGCRECNLLDLLTWKSPIIRR